MKESADMDGWRMGIEADPIRRFEAALAAARAVDRAIIPDATAFALATVDTLGYPAVRIVLLKGVDERGFVFYTNYESRKGRELLASPQAALCFHWAPLEVQVRVEGRVVPVSAAEADAYFATRARGSQIGAWASIQSRPLDRYATLEDRVESFTREFEGREVPRPPHWSGFRVVPERIEFWKGRANRLHERHVYTRREGEWAVEMLYP
ncbi:MAG TPA: pyridoxamine 5'-phosphate oxidase [Gemmatimonadaceae bacterium]|nr:pyridoxamine 5'-phosphate oxidase [Gemmatimonadaceae bacterium]